MIDNLSIAIHVFDSRTLMLFSVDERLRLRLVHLSTNFKESPFKVEMSPFFVVQSVGAVEYTDCLSAEG